MQDKNSGSRGKLSQKSPNSLKSPISGSQENHRRERKDSSPPEIQAAMPVPEETPLKDYGHHRKRSRRPSKTVPMITLGTTLKGRFELSEIIGAGGYGQIFKAMDSKTKTNVAIKVMVHHKDSQRMVLEQHILMKLRGKTQYPQLVGSGNFTKDKEVFMFIAMELLGRSLSDLRKRCDGKRFDPCTVIRIGIQSVTALQVLHELGYIHRDIKPGNICTGLGSEAAKKIYLVDFGLARQFKEKGKVKRRVHAGFRGTLRYVSVNVHERRDQTPCDDMISLFYSLVEMGEGSLPWTRLKDSDDIARRKKTIKHAELSKLLPPQMEEFFTYCNENCEDPNDPNYDQLIEPLKKCLPANFNPATPMGYEAIEKMGGTGTSQDTNGPQAGSP